MVNTDIDFSNSNSLYLRSLKMIELRLSIQSRMYFRQKLSKYSNQLIYRTMFSMANHYKETLDNMSDCKDGVDNLKASKTSYIIGSLNKTMKDFNTKIHFNFI